MQGTKKIYFNLKKEASASFFMPHFVSLEAVIGVSMG